MDLKKEYDLLYMMQQTYSSLFFTSNKVQAAGDKYYEPVTSRQYMAMMAIMHLPEDETTYNNIAQKLGTTKQNVTQIIKVLEKKEYVKVEPSKKDKRSVNVSVSESGKEVLVKCGESAGINFMADLFKNFTDDEIKTLWNLLKKLYAFDGTVMDGFEKDANTEGVSQEELEVVLEKFAQRRKG